MSQLSLVLIARLPTEGWLGWVGMVDWLHTKMVHPPADGHPSKY